ncbi:hypothetical protein K0M31_005710, partial [Melipona bicolor]
MLSGTEKNKKKKKKKGRAAAACTRVNRQPSFAIVGEIAIAGVDAKFQGTWSRDIIEKDK